MLKALSGGAADGKGECMLKPGCYECVYRGTIPGDCHSCCNHPEFKAAWDDPTAGLVMSLGKRLGPVIVEGEGSLYVVILMALKRVGSITCLISILCGSKNAQGLRRRRTDVWRTV